VVTGTDVAVLTAARLIQSGAVVTAQHFIRLACVARAPAALVAAVCHANTGAFEKAYDAFVEAAAGAGAAAAAVATVVVVLMAGW
jgi:hypothetical protein